MEWKFKTHRDAIMIASYPSPSLRGQQRADGVVKVQETCLGLKKWQKQSSNFRYQGKG